jgi:hypothetical protein
MIYILLSFIMMLGPYMMMNAHQYPEHLVKTSMMMSVVIVFTSMLMILFSLVYIIILFFWR